MRIAPIRTQEDHKTALDRIDALWGAEPGTPEGDEMDVLIDLVELHEAKLLGSVLTQSAVPAKGSRAAGGQWPRMRVAAVVKLETSDLDSRLKRMRLLNRAMRRHPEFWRDVAGQVTPSNGGVRAA